MNAPKNVGPRTIGELKAYLTELEASWTDMDDQYLGKFDDQQLYVGMQGQGIARAEAQFHGEFGLVLFDITTVDNSKS